MASYFTRITNISLRGSNGSEVQIFKDKHGKEFAGKVINRSRYPNYKQEIENLRAISGECSNVINFFTTFEESRLNPEPIIMMELCDCNLSQFVENTSQFVPLTNHTISGISPKQYFSDVTKIKLAEQVCKGVEFLHRKKIIHGGIHPKNILMRRLDGVTTAKLSSFGFSKILPENMSGTFSADFEGIGFTAPECSKESAKTRKSADIFSLGLVLFYLFSDGKHLFGKTSDLQQKKINKENRANFLNLRNRPELYGLTKEQAVCAVALIKKMICNKESERYRIEDVIHYPLYWPSQRKIFYYETVCKHLKSDTNLSKVIHVLQTYKGDLLQESSNKNVKFAISPSLLPFDAKFLDGRTGIYACCDVRGLLRVIRNLAQHLTDKATPSEVKKVLGVRLDNSSYDPDIFITRLTEPYPQLLAHVYEVFRNRNIPGDFYPKSGETSLTLPQEDVTLSTNNIYASPSHKVAEKFQHRTPNIPDNVRSLAKQYGIIEEDLFRCDMEVQYSRVNVLDKIINLNTPVRIVGPDYASTSTSLECINLPEFKGKGGLSKILENLKGGLILFGSSSGCGMAAKRDSIIRVYLGSKKLEQDVEVEFFSISDFLCGTCESFIHSKVVFCIGSDPEDPKALIPAVEVIITPHVVPKVKASQLADGSTHSLVEESMVVATTSRLPSQ